MNACGQKNKPRPDLFEGALERKDTPDK